jgi:hypothetical protein
MTTARQRRRARIWKRAQRAMPIMPTCQVPGCPMNAAARHHPDYRRPLNFIPMCYLHHRHTWGRMKLK